MKLLTIDRFVIWEALEDVPLTTNTPHKYHIPKGTFFYVSDTLLVHYYPNRKQTQIWKVGEVKYSKENIVINGRIKIRPIDIVY